MKIDRLLEMIIYLFNHENVSASRLAEKFHVSVRTFRGISSAFLRRVYRFTLWAENTADIRSCQIID